MSDAELRELFERNADRTDVGEYGAGVSDEWCARAEEAIGLTLPPSYRWWLQKYGRGSILGDEIFGIYEKDFDKVVGGDVVYQYRLHQKNGWVRPSHIPVCHSDIDGLFVLDMTQVREDREAPVVWQPNGKVYAQDFSEFLQKRLAIE